MAAIMRGLPQEQMRALREDLRGHGDRLREGLRGQRELSTALSTTLRAIPFDLEAFADVLVRQRGRVSELQAIGHEALVARVATMSDEERAHYADELGRAPRRNVNR